MATTCKLIAKSVLGSGANTLDFQSIPATYTDLLLLCSARTDYNSALKYGLITITFNNSGGTAYSNRRVLGEGLAAYSYSDTSQANVGLTANGSSSTADTFGSMAIYVPNYAGSTNKSFSVSSVTETNATDGLINEYAALWANTAAIDRLTLTAGAGNFVANSSAYLYGILKA